MPKRPEEGRTKHATHQDSNSWWILLIPARYADEDAAAHGVEAPSNEEERNALIAELQAGGVRGEPVDLNNFTVHGAAVANL